MDLEGDEAKELGKRARWSPYSEKEVVLMPQFCFQVLDVRNHPSVVLRTN